MLSLLRNGWYRFRLRTGRFEKVMVISEFPHLDEPFFSGDNFTVSSIKRFSKPALCNDLLAGNLPFFSHQCRHLGNPPEWFFDPLSGRNVGGTREHWTRVRYDPDLDIKLIWEPSRFDWLLLLARAYCAEGSRIYLDTMNAWLKDWALNNPLNSGPNWLCGQEAAIRVIHLLLSSFLLNEWTRPSRSFSAMIRHHCARIEPTILYAVSQNNNHATSEAAALFIAGLWLERYGSESDDIQNGKRWCGLGRKWLENRVNKLVAEDGTFSQYSVNYQRLFLDTISQVEFWRRRFDAAEFSTTFYERMRAATCWLYDMVAVTTGEAPNIGNNDGARICVLSETPYHDYRPSIQLAAVLFHKQKFYSDNHIIDEPLQWLRMPCRIFYNREKISKLFDDGGFCLLLSTSKRSWGVVKYPRYSFRPAQSDIFHFDLWVEDKNILGDAGTCQYNINEPWYSYFPGVTAHNTVQFDGRDQMIRIGRFLFGPWPKAKTVTFFSDENRKEWAGEYVDYCGAEHKRKITADNCCWVIEDRLRGFTNNAVLRWRLSDDLDWKIVGTQCIADKIRIIVDSDVDIIRAELTSGWKSKYYTQRKSIYVFEVEIQQPGKLITTIKV